MHAPERCLLMKSRYSLQRTMIIYFLLIGFASMLVGVEFLADFHSGSLKNEIWQNINTLENENLNPDTIFAPLTACAAKRS